MPIEAAIVRSHDSDSDTTNPDWLRGPICNTARKTTFKPLQAADYCLRTAAQVCTAGTANALQIETIPSVCAERQCATIPSAKAGRSPTTRSLHSGIAQECALRAAFPTR